MMLLDHYVRSYRLCEFLDEVISMRNADIEEKTNWEFFLHRVFDKSYMEYMREVGRKPAEPEVMEVEQIETTVNKSMQILESLKI